MSCGCDSRDPDEIKMSVLVVDAKNLGLPSSSRVTHADVASSALTSEAVDLLNPFVRPLGRAQTVPVSTDACGRRPPLRSIADAAWT